MTNEELTALRTANIPRGVPATAPVYAAKAKNAIVTDVEGREYIDFAAGIGVMNVGHCHPKVVEAVKAQADLFSHTCFGLVGYEPYLRLAEKLNQLRARQVAQAHLLRQLRRRGRRERHQDRPLRHQAPGPHRLRGRVPRAHHHDPQPHLAGEPLQDGLRAVRPRGLPRPLRLLLPLPAGPRVPGLQVRVRRAPAQRLQQARERRRGGRGHRRARAGRGRVHRPAPGVHGQDQEHLRRARHPA